MTSTPAPRDDDRLCRRHSVEWEELVKRAPKLGELTTEQFRALFEGAEPATEDDVPWTFPVRTPLKSSRPRPE